MTMKTLLLLTMLVSLNAHAGYSPDERDLEQDWDAGLIKSMLVNEHPAVRTLGVAYSYRNKSKSYASLPDQERTTMDRALEDLLAQPLEKESLQRLMVAFCTPEVSPVCVNHDLASRYLAEANENMSTYLDLMALSDTAPLRDPQSGEDILPEKRADWLMSRAVQAPVTDNNPFYATDLMADAIREHATRDPYPEHISTYDDRVTDENVHYVLTAGYNAAFVTIQPIPVTEYCEQALDRKREDAIGYCKVIAMRLQQSGTTLIQVMYGLSLQKSLIQALYPDSDYWSEFSDHAIRQRATLDCLSAVLDEDILLSDLGERYFSIMSAEGEISAMMFLLDQRAEMNDELNTLCSFETMAFPSEDTAAMTGDVR